jgi:formyltetrahydrofolate-dependent phosphoribosylglycinamide formyltransferase
LYRLALATATGVSASRFLAKIHAMQSASAQSGPLRLGVLISGGGTTLANLIARRAADRLRNCAITLVISSRSTVAGVDIARRAELPLRIIRRRDFPGLSEFSDALVAALDAAKVELVVMAGFLCLWRIPPRYRGRVLNIHPALLPGYGGRGMYGHHVHAAVLAAGESESGCTVHLADDQYDHGPIIAQTRVPVRADDTPETLAERVGVAERELYPHVIQSVADHGPGWLARQAEVSGAVTPPPPAAE